MISQERFDELTVFARKGPLETMEAIKLAIHESLAAEQAKNAELIAELANVIYYMDDGEVDAYEAKQRALITLKKAKVKP